jgi:hydrogenase maturation protease
VSLLVLGLGNVLCGDDGLGVAATELLRRRYRIPERVRVLDGGTLGLALLSHIEASDDVILVDAIRGAGPSGTFVRLEGADVEPAVRSCLSCHQVGVADLLDALHMLQTYPRHLVLLGLVPESLELCLGRSPQVEEQLPRLVERIVVEASRLGYEFLPVAGDESCPAERRNPAVRVLGL